jgi:glutaredoxin-related protein
VSVDSIFCHANWARDLGGVSFPLLADFHPKGQMAASYGLYLEDKGITDRATVLIDAGGTVQYAHSVTPAGERDLDELVGLCEKVDREIGRSLPPDPPPPGMPRATLFVKNSCGFSRAALLARANLHLEDQVEVKNVSESPDAMEELEKVADGGQAPCLLVEGKPVLESQEIVELFASKVAPV